MKKLAKEKGYKTPKSNNKDWTLDADIKPVVYGLNKKKNKTNISTSGGNK